MTPAAGAIVLGAVGLGVGVPWLFMRMLVPSLAAAPSSRAVNYRGREVHYGLGIVWLVWAGCALVAGVAGAAFGADGLAAPVLTLAGPLALVAFAMGVVDDAYGSGESRGFRGHLRAMLKGRLTTGGLKLLGIGLASLVVALVLAQVAPWGAAHGDGPAASGWGVAARYGAALVAGAAIALTSNLVNLTDLRPGRALKTYALLALAGVASTAALGAARSIEGAPSGLDLAAETVALAAFVAGPVVAVWGQDLGEQGMLGDAGANPMGAVAGMLIVMGLPTAGLLGYFAFVLALNLASERVSFSRVIEGNAVLSWLDRLGRVPPPTPPQVPGVESGEDDVGPPV